MKKYFGYFQNDAFRANLVILVLTAAVASSYALNGSLLWGWQIDMAPIWFWLAIIAAALVFTNPAISGKIGNRLAQRLARGDNLAAKLTYAALSCAFLALTLILHSRNHLLGDGHNIIGNVNGGQLLSATEPLEYLLHRAIVVMAGVDAAVSYRVASFGAALALLVGFYFLFSRKANHLFALVLLACSATVQFFFGYVENYTFSFVFAVFFLIFSWRDFEKERISAATVIFLGLAVAFHVRSLVFLPTLIYLIHRKSGSAQRTLVFVAISLMVIVAAVILADVSRVKAAQFFVPPWPTEINPYHLFSAAHLKDMLNIAVLNFPMLALLLLIPTLARAAIRPFWLLAILPALLLTFLVDPKIGALRDWDLLSTAAAPVLVFLLCHLDTLRPSPWGKFAIIIPLLVFGILRGGGWVYQNSQKDESYKAIKEIIRRDLHYSGTYYKGYRNRSWAQIAYTNYGDVPELVRAQEVRYHGDPADTTAMLQVAVNGLLLGDTLKAVGVVQDNWQKYTRNSHIIGTFGAVMVSAGRLEEANRIYATYLREGGDDFKIMNDIALINKQLGDSVKAIYYFDMAFRKLGKPATHQELPFYLSIIPRGQYDIAESGLRRILERIPGQWRADAGRIIAALSEKRYAVADSLARIMIAIIETKKIPVEP
jgi:hypothetical protein